MTDLQAWQLLVCNATASICSSSPPPLGCRRCDHIFHDRAYQALEDGGSEFEFQAVHWQGPPALEAQFEIGIIGQRSTQRGLVIHSKLKRQFRIPIEVDSAIRLATDLTTTTKQPPLVKPWPSQTLDGPNPGVLMPPSYSKPALVALDSALDCNYAHPQPWRQLAPFHCLTCRVIRPLPTGTQGHPSVSSLRQTRAAYMCLGTVPAS